MPELATIVIRCVRMTRFGTLGTRLMNIAQHTIATVGCLLSIWLVHLVLKWLLGPEWEIFDLVPIRYLIDAGEATILLKLVWHLVREFA